MAPNSSKESLVTSTFKPLPAEPLVSVMVITYNQAHFIRETLDSILSQDYPHLEIVVADDASTDDTPKILEEYAARYPGRVKPILNAANLGITGNSNVALFGCTGDLIAVMGGDDLFLPGKVSKQVEAFHSNPEAVLCFHPVDIFESQSNETIFVTDQHAREDIQSYRDIILKGGIAGASSVMVRPEAIPAGGFDERLPWVSDWQFYIEVALRGEVIKVNEVLGRYRKHGFGASDRTFELLDESLYALDLVVEKNPEFKDLPALCRQGKARYIAGEAFRQLTKNPQIAAQLAKRCVELAPGSNRYRTLRAFAVANRWVPGMSWLTCKMVPYAKYALKRRLG